MAKVILTPTYFIGLPVKGGVAIFSDGIHPFYSSRKKAKGYRDEIVSKAVPPKLKELGIYEVTSMDVKRVE